MRAAPFGKLDPTAVGKVIELVLGGVLIHPHGDPAARLDRGERAVSAARIGGRLRAMRRMVRVGLCLRAGGGEEQHRGKNGRERWSG